MSETKGLWCGKPLEDFTKEELIDIILEMNRERLATHDRHRADLEMLR